MKLKPFILMLFILHLTTVSVSAFEFETVRVRNLSPTALVQTLATAESARLVSPGGYNAYLDLDLASHAVSASSAGEQLVFDGETMVATVGLRRGVGERLQVGFELPWISHDEGSLDGFISDWHDFFGLPNGDRDQLPTDTLSVRYSRDGDELLNLEHSTNGIGDLRLLLAWQLAVDETSAAAVHASLKVPTGDAAKLTGSEAWGASLALALDHRIPLESGASAAIWGGLGGRWLGDGEVLAARARTWAANAWLGAGWSPLQWLAFKLQLDSQTALYDSELSTIGSPAVILTMGGTLSLAERTNLDLYVMEDLAVNNSPDVTFHLGLSHGF